MLPVTLDQLHVFVTVAREGSFSGAARALHRAQSAISYAVANLERLLDVALFDRSHRTPTLTDAGRALLADATTIQRHVDQMTARAQTIAEGVEAQLSVVVDTMFPLRVLVDALRQAKEAFPHVTLRLYTASLGAAVKLVSDGVCSLGFCIPIHRYPDDIDRSVVTELLLVPVCAPGHPLSKLAPPLTVSVLSDHTQIVLTDTSDLTEGIDAGVLSPKTWRVADLAAKHEFLRAGFGWGNMPSHRVEEDIAQGRLVRIFPAALPEALRVPLFAVWRHSDPPGKAGTWLRSTITELFDHDLD